MPPRFLKPYEEYELKLDDFPSFSNSYTPQNQSVISTKLKSKLTPIKMNLIGKYNSLMNGCNRYLSKYLDYEK